MARAFARSLIAQRARFDADLEGSNVGISDARVNDLINEHYAELWDLLTEAGLSDYNASSTTLTTTPGTAATALPSDFYKISAVMAVEAVGRTRPIYPLNEGAMMRLRPPQGAYQAVLEYVPACPVIDTSSAGDATTLDGISGWEGLIVKQVARRILRKESTLDVASVLDADIAEMKRRISRAAKRTGPRFINDREAQDRYGCSNLLSAYRIRGNNIELYQQAYGWPWA